MKRLILSSALVLALASGGYIYRASADTNPPAAPPAPDHAPGSWPGFHHGCGPARPPGPPGFGPGFWLGAGWGHHHKDQFSLFAPVKNKNLSAADVKTIAMAMLLEHGNHDWTVTNITPESDKSIDFSFATPHGDVVATFAVDPASGRINRVS